MSGNQHEYLCFVFCTFSQWIGYDVFGYVRSVLPPNSVPWPKDAICSHAGWAAQSSHVGWAAQTSHAGWTQGVIFFAGAHKVVTKYEVDFCAEKG